MEKNDPLKDYIFNQKDWYCKCGKSKFVAAEFCTNCEDNLKIKKHEKAKTFDDGKEPLAQLPWAAIDELSRVQAYGHTKYKDFNNYRKGLEVTRNLSCAIRHIRDYLNGADKDHESGRNPLAHAMCRIAFVLQNIAEGKEIDDRYKQPKQSNTESL